MATSPTVRRQSNQGVSTRDAVDTHGRLLLCPSLRPELQIGQISRVVQRQEIARHPYGA